MTENTNVLIIHHEPERYFETLCKRFPQLHFYSAGSDAEVMQLMTDVQPQVLLSFRCDSISSATQSLAVGNPCVKWVQVAGAGYDHLGELDNVACRVTNCAGVLSRFQAETVIGAMINLNFGFFRYQLQQQKKQYLKLPWRSLEGQKLLLIGMGHIGRAVAVNARHFGMHVTAIRSRIQESPEADVVCTPDQVPDLLPDADFVSLHLPYNTTTHHYFDAKMFRAMKQSAYFVNSARGNIVNEDALVSALQNGEIAGAYLDVFREEPIPQSSQLWQLNNALISPHYCDSVADWRERFAAFFADNLGRWIGGDELYNLVT